jgi:hypothetical protein
MGAGLFVPRFVCDAIGAVAAPLRNGAASPQFNRFFAVVPAQTGIPMPFLGAVRLG